MVLTILILQIRIGVKVCAVNKADIKCIEGNDSIVRLPFIPGSEFAGEILEVGKNCKEGLMPGDKVAVLRGTSDKFNFA